MNNNILIYTDGACNGNPGPGGWAAIIIYPNGKETILRGSDKDTTNNRMELASVIAALRSVADVRSEITLYSDSQYVVKGVDWAKGWRKNNWVKPDGKPALNKEQWEELLSLADPLNIKFIWVKGHAGNEYNERCDRIAVEEAAIAAGSSPGTSAPVSAPASKAVVSSLPFDSCVLEAQRIWDSLSDETREELEELNFSCESPAELLDNISHYSLPDMNSDVKAAFMYVMGFIAFRKRIKELLEM